MMMKLMAIDGNSIVNRAFYGIRMLNAPDGTPTNAVYGFVAILLKLIAEEQPDGICVAFDLKAPTFRHEQFEGYKAQRKGMPEELVQQMPVLKKVLDAMGIYRVELAGYEADDLLGTISRRAEAEGSTCVIVTGDKDSFQLITDRTTVLHVKTRMGNTETVEYTSGRFREEYGFEPEKMVDLKALMGDSSDNIPGVPGIGEKTALDLLHQFGSLEGVYGNIQSGDIKPGVRKKLMEGEDSAKMSYTLAAIVTDVPVVFRAEDARWTGEYTPELYDVFRVLGFTKFIDKLGLKNAEASAADTSAVNWVRWDITDRDTLDRALEEMSGGSAAVWCTDLEEVFIAPGGERVYALRRENYSGDFDGALRDFFAADINKSGHNIKAVMRSLMERGIPVRSWTFDTALAAYLLDSGAGSYDPERLAVKYCGFEIPRSGERDGQLSLLVEDGARLDELAATAGALAVLAEKLASQLRELGMDKLYREIELPLCLVLAEMERDGFRADRDSLVAYGEMLSKGIEDSSGKIYALAGEEVNINSTKKLGEILFEKLGLPPVKRTKTGYSTNIEVLEKLRGRHPIIDEIIRFRQLTKLKSTYADGLLKVIAPDGRIHTTFQMTVTATGRLSSIEPNLQNIPVRQELGSELRRMFVAKEGCVLVDADYSQIELRILAHISGDEAMGRAFADGSDIHAVTASQVFGVPLEQVTHEMRTSAKAVNFGIVYGISDFSLSQDIGVPKYVAKEYIESYFAKYSGVKRYMDSVVEQAKHDGYVTTLFGRRRYIPELKSSNYNLRSFGERAAMNTPIQGTAADIIKLAMVRVADRLKRENMRSRLILQVHDELILESPEDECEKAKALLKEEMESVVQLSVPLRADAKSGRSWFDAK